MVNKLHELYETEDSLPCSQQPADSPYPQPNLSTPCNESYLFKIHFNIIPISICRSSKCCIFSSSPTITLRPLYAVNPIYLRSILILSPHLLVGLLSAVFFLSFPTTTFRPIGNPAAKKSLRVLSKGVSKMLRYVLSKQNVKMWTWGNSVIGGLLCTTQRNCGFHKTLDISWLAVRYFGSQFGVCSMEFIYNAIIDSSMYNIRWLDGSES